MLKKDCKSTAEYVTRRYARNRSAAESYIQLPISRNPGAQGSSAARHPSHGWPSLAQLSRRFAGMYATVGRASFCTVFGKHDVALPSFNVLQPLIALVIISHTRALHRKLA